MLRMTRGVRMAGTVVFTGLMLGACVQPPETDLPPRTPEEITRVNPRDPDIPIPPPVSSDTAQLGWVQECPRYWRDTLRRTEINLTVVGERRTEVPEFHDCQKLLVQRGQAYGPLVAIFSTWLLDSLEEHLNDVNTTRPGAPHHDVEAAAGALIINFDERYRAGDLVIEAGFSCVYLWRQQGRWAAGILPVQSESMCLEPINPAGVTGMNRLTVYADSAPGFEGRDYPPVARWDYDPVTHQQYMGLKCGAAWCEIGSTSFNRSPAVPGAGRVTRIKGWYDQQFLAIQDAAGKAVPSRLTGTLIPHEGLDTYTQADFDGRWARVAYVALQGPRNAPFSAYEAKLNLSQTGSTPDLEKLNKISMCRGTRTQCKGANAAPPCGTTTEVRWWGRITSAANTTRYRCIVLEDHTGKVHHVPGSARWRWIENDETTWTRCLEGCCEIDAISG